MHKKIEQNLCLCRTQVDFVSENKFTLSLWFIKSLYNAVLLSRVLMNWKYGNKPVQSLSIQPIWVRA